MISIFAHKNIFSCVIKYSRPAGRNISVNYVRYFSSSDGDNSGLNGPDSNPPSKSPIVERGAQTKGAMKTYMFNIRKTQNETSETTGVFAKLRKSISAPASSETRSWTSTKSAPTTSPTTTNNPSSTGRVWRNNLRPGMPKSRRSGDKKEGRMRIKISQGDELTEAEKGMLFDLDYFKTLARKGLTIDSSEMDNFDKFLATTLVESLKSSDDSYRYIAEDPSFRRTFVPKARPIKKLLQSIRPDIHSVAPDSPGYELGVQAWEVLSKNLYYSEQDRDEMANNIARLADKILTQAANMTEDCDMIYDPSFRRGPVGMEEEERRKAEAYKPPEAKTQGVTNWDVTAVKDEDDL